MNVDFAITTPSKWAIESLDERGDLIVSPKNNSWITSRTVWAKVISSANIDGDATIRNENILYTGNLNTFDSSYDNRTFKPKYGIDSIKVFFKGTMGSTKGCTISFKCWTLDDLQILEQLYMVPGISLIAEWGYSVTPSGMQVSPIAEFETLSPQENPYPYIMEKIIANRETYEGNYDGLVGIITNFNYKLNDQLGFDCEVELVSPGEMWLEQNMTNSSKNCTDIEGDTVKSHNNLEFAFGDLYKNYRDPGMAGAINDGYKRASTAEPLCVIQYWDMESRQYDKDHMSLLEKGTEYVFTTTDHPEVYISWAYFVTQLNYNINKYQLTISGIPTDESKKNPEIALALDFVPVTVLPKFYSLDPRVCTFIPVNVDLTAGKTRKSVVKAWWKNIIPAVIDAIVGETDGIRQIQGSGLVPPMHNYERAEQQIYILGTALDIKNAESNIEKIKKTLSADSHTGLLNNVYLNAGFLRDVALVNVGEQLSIDDYLKKVLGELNNATGDIWNLQYYVDDLEPNIIHVYDASYTNRESRDNNKIDPYKFTLLQTDTTATKLLIHNATVESKLVDGFKSLVLYGNSSDNGNNDTANIGMNLYSNKVSDGWKLSQNINNSTSFNSATTCVKGNGEIVDKSEFKDPAADLDVAYLELLDAVTDESVASAKSAMASYIAWINSENPELAVKFPRNQNILLPFNFGISIDGFSGFIWGNVISFDYLPARYGDRIYFQITKMNHDITRENWITNIETVMRLKPDMNVKNPPAKPRKKQEEKPPVQEQVDSIVNVPGGRVGGQAYVDKDGLIRGNKGGKGF